MEISKFLADFAEQFDDTDASEIQEETVFHDLDEWSSLSVMLTIAFFDEEYDKQIGEKEISESETIQDLYNKATA